MLSARQFLDSLNVIFRVMCDFSHDVRLEVYNSKCPLATSACLMCCALDTRSSPVSLAPLLTYCLFLAYVAVLEYCHICQVVAAFAA